MQFFQLIGTQRSGSNLFRLMLNELDDFFAPHSPHLLSTFFPIIDSYKNLNNDENFRVLVDDMLRWVKFNPVKWSKIPSYQKINETIDYRNIFQIFKSIYTFDNPKFWSCKSLQNFVFYDNVDFKKLNPIYIYIYRDGRDVACSFKNAAIGEKHIYNIAQQWKSDQTKCLEIQNKVDPYFFFKVKYEDLLSKPTSVLKDFCKKYGIIFNENFLNFYKSNESKKTSVSGKLWENLSRPLITNNSGKYRNQLSENEILIFESINHELLIDLGYSLENESHKLIKSFSLREVDTFNSVNDMLKKKAKFQLNKVENNLLLKQRKILIK